MMLQHATLLNEFAAALGKSAATVDAYRRAVRQALDWLRERPGQEEGFHPDHLTRTAVESYLTHLERQGLSANHQARVKAALSAFATFLIEEKGWLRRNPTRGIVLPAQALLAPRMLSPEQRYALRSGVERDGTVRSAALFALGYWAGGRVSDVSWLRLSDTHLTRKAGWLRVGYKNGKTREIDLLNEARRAVAEYLARTHQERTGDSHGDPADGAGVRLLLPAPGASHRGGHPSLATGVEAAREKAEWDLIHEVTFHDLRHDFAHRAREAGWSLEEVAYYLGHVTKKGTPAIQTTARYTQVSREQVAAKLRLIKG